MPYIINTYQFLTNNDWYWLGQYHTCNFVQSEQQQVPWGLQMITCSGILCGRTLGWHHGQYQYNFTSSTAAFARFYIQRNKILGGDQHSFPWRMDSEQWWQSLTCNSHGVPSWVSGCHLKISNLLHFVAPPNDLSILLQAMPSLEHL